MGQIAVWLCIVIAILAAAAAGTAAFFLGMTYRKNKAESEIGSAEQEAKRIVADAVKSAEAKKKEIVLEGKDELHRLRDESEKELNNRRKEIQHQERRVLQKEESLEKKLESMERKESQIDQKNKKAEQRLQEAEAVKKSQFDMLERISSFTVEQAKEYLLNNLESELTHEKAVKIREFEQQTKEDADKSAREIIALAIQRCAADHVSEAAISVVPLPNDEMKGRIIGREGRNIRAIETLTGVDLIIDDTPEAITLSSFEPVRREVARIALEKLITDGRIHPTRIEETVEKARREVESTIKQEGERAVLEVGVNGVHHELVKLLGRLRYRTSYGQNVLNHSLEVAYLAGMMASELGLTPPWPNGPACCTTSARPWITRWRALMCRSAWKWPGNTGRARRSSTPSPPTMEMWKPRRSSPVWCRLLTPSPRPAPAPAARTWKTTSSAWKSWKRWPPPLTGWRAATPSRPAARSALWCAPKGSATSR